MQELTRFKDILRKSGHFATKQRVSLFKYLQANPEVSIKQVVSETPNQDQATVYRNIKLFEKLGIISKLRLGWKSRLELTNKFHDHHHHMNCIKCGKIIAWEEDPTIELRIQTVALKQGFLPQNHQLEIHGICQACQ